jgi:hypothetical protein
MIRHALDRLRHRRRDMPHMRQQLAAGGGRRDAAADPLEQADAEPPFELADAQADRRLRQVEALCRERDAAGGNDLFEGLQLVETESAHCPRKSYT